MVLVDILGEGIVWYLVPSKPEPAKITSESPVVFEATDKPVNQTEPATESVTETTNYSTEDLPNLSPKLRDKSA
jgi:hypothetical protein